MSRTQRVGFGRSFQGKRILRISLAAAWCCSMYVRGAQQTALLREGRGFAEDYLYGNQIYYIPADGMKSGGVHVFVMVMVAPTNSPLSSWRAT